jgi:hypothetical protein
MLRMSSVLMQLRQSPLSLPVHSLAASSLHSMRAPAGPLESSGLRKHSMYIMSTDTDFSLWSQVQVRLLPEGVLLQQADLVNAT